MTLHLYFPMTRIQINLLIITLCLTTLSVYLIHSGNAELAVAVAAPLAIVVKKLVDEEDNHE